MNYCPECMTVGGHHANCPNAEDCNEKETAPMKYCEYCDTTIHLEDVKTAPDNLPDDIPWPEAWDVMHYHKWCFDEHVHEMREELRP